MIKIRGKRNQNQIECLTNPTKWHSHIAPHVTLYIIPPLLDPSIIIESTNSWQSRRLQSTNFLQFVVLLVRSL